ncbi:MAG: 1-acyl-sn-glycerol-3-phosphate acyltransferase [Acholeplasmatales bacterium]|jgi:1-acyl-sn-glycerol-3-phosphate acyltransferase|nr:1-acyl-sn-glycerol-3-phosphate acyltransferase [Acholeplasmatales bacterium]
MPKKLNLCQKIFNIHRIIYDYIKWKIWVFWPLYRTKVYYLKSKKEVRLKQGAYFMSVNHFTRLEFMILYSTFWYRRIHGVASLVLFNNPFNRFFFSFTTICVDQDNFGPSSVKKIRRVIEYGYPIVINPEGHIAKEAQIGEFKPGIVRFALSMGVDIIPVYAEKVRFFHDRQRIMVGERLDIKALSNPQKSARDNASSIAQYLQEYTIHLKKNYEARRIVEKTTELNYLYLYNLNNTFISEPTINRLNNLGILPDNHQLVALYYFLTRVIRDDFYFTNEDIAFIFQQQILPHLSVNFFNFQLGDFYFCVHIKDSLICLALSKDPVFMELLMQKCFVYPHRRTIALAKVKYYLSYKANNKYRFKLVNILKENKPSYLE